MRRSLVSLLVGIAMAAMAVFLIGQYKNTISNAAPKNGNAIETVNIVVASKDLKFGTKIIPDNITYAVWPKGSVPEGAFTDKNALLKNENGEDSNRVVIREILAGEPFSKKKVSGFGTKPTLSRKVAEDMRAFTIRINDVSGVAGFLLPGDKVDVMLTRNASDSRDNLITDVILQNVTVLGVDQLIDEGAGKPVVAKTATVEVDAQQAQKLALAQQIGTLSLSLRNYSDSKKIEAGRVSVSDLALLNEPDEEKSQSSGKVIRVRRGTELDYTRMP